MENFTPLLAQTIPPIALQWLALGIALHDASLDPRTGAMAKVKQVLPLIMTDPIAKKIKEALGQPVKMKILMGSISILTETDEFVWEAIVRTLDTLAKSRASYLSRLKEIDEARIKALGI